MLSCHWYIGALPLATTVKLVFDPVHVTELAGCVVIFTGVFTVNDPQFETAAGAQVPPTTQR